MDRLRNINAVLRRLLNRNRNNNANNGRNDIPLGRVRRRRRRRRRAQLNPNIPGTTPEEQRWLRRIRMRCIDRIPEDLYPEGMRLFIFQCRCCNTEFSSPYRWGGNRKTYHADTRTHQINFAEYARVNNITYPPLNLPPRVIRVRVRPAAAGPENPPPAAAGPNPDQGNNAGGGAQPNVPEAPVMVDVGIDAMPLEQLPQ